MDTALQSNGFASGPQKTLFAIAGGKGGVGKTTIAVTMGAVLADYGHKTVIVDADLGGANLHHAFGVLRPAVTIGDFIRGEQNDINRLVLETTIPNLHIVAGSAGTLGMADIRYDLKQKFLRHLHLIDAEYVILDIGAGTSFNQLDYFLEATCGIVVITPDSLAIQDGFNFIKTSLLRKLFQLFQGEAALIARLRPYFNLSRKSNPFSIAEISEEIKAFGPEKFTRWRTVLAAFQPKIIVNKFESDKDFEECAVLQIAAKDILDLKLAEMYCIRNSQHVHNAIRNMCPDQLLGGDGIVIGDMQLIVEKICSNGFSRNRKIKIKTNRNHAEKDLYDEPDLFKGELICSIRCGLWENCSMQRGGYPCRIKIIGAANQKNI